MADVLIFEDDPAVGDLAADFLRHKGLTVDHFLAGAGAVSLVAERRPRLVVLDIMMPGMDGLSVCRELRADPRTKAVKIVMLTAKDSSADAEAARRYGADLYLRKPFSPSVFARDAGRLLGFPADPPPSAGQAPPAPPVSVTLLPGAAAVQSAGLWVLFDAGRGLRDWLERQTCPPPECWLLLTRYAPDAISELSAAGLLLAAGARLRLGGPDDPESTLSRVAPAVVKGAGAARPTPLLHPQREGEFALAPGVPGACLYAQHPGTTLAYRVDIQGRGVVWCPANDARPGPEGGHDERKFQRLFREADLVLHGWRRAEAQPRADDGLGTGSWEAARDLCAAAGAKRLALFPLPGSDPAAAPPDGASPPQRYVL